jgi:hypothetical protein
VTGSGYTHNTVVVLFVVVDFEPVVDVARL